MTPQFFYTDKYNTWDYVTILLYLLWTMIIYIRPERMGNMGGWIASYTIGTHLFLYLLNYKSLRKFNVWIVWIGFSLVHIYFYQDFGANTEFKRPNGSVTNGLQFTWVALILFQLLRLISIKTQDADLVAPAGPSRFDLWDNRRTNFIDYSLFAIYMVVMTVLDVVLGNN